MLHDRLQEHDARLAEPLVEGVGGGQAEGQLAGLRLVRLAALDRHLHVHQREAEHAAPLAVLAQRLPSPPSRKTRQRVPAASGVGTAIGAGLAAKRLHADRQPAKCDCPLIVRWHSPVTSTAFWIDSR